MQNTEDNSSQPQLSPTFDAPGRNGFVPERLLGRTEDDFFSTAHSSMNLEEICLENIVMAHLNQDILKKNFEIIISALRLQAQKIAGVYKHFNSYDDAINEIKEGLFQNDKKLEEIKDLKISGGGGDSKEVTIQKEIFLKEIRTLKEKDAETIEEVNQLRESILLTKSEIMEKEKESEKKIETHTEAIQVQETQSNDLQIRISTMEQNFADCKENLSSLSAKYDSFESKIHLIESLSSKGEGPDLSAIINQIGMFRQQLKDYVLIDDFQKYKDYFTLKTEETFEYVKKIEPIEKIIQEVKINEIPEVEKHVEIVATQTSELELSVMKKIVDLEEKISSLGEKPENGEIHPVKVDSEELERLTKEMIEKELARKVNMEDYYAVSREIEGVKENIEIALTQIKNLYDFYNENTNNKPDKPPPIITNPNSLSHKDLAQLKELANKTNDLESLIRKLQRETQELQTGQSTLVKDFKENVKTMDERKLDRSEIKLDKIEDMIKKFPNFENELKNLKDKMYSLEKSVGLNEVGLNDLMKELSKIKKRGSLGENSGVKKEEINKLLEETLKAFKKDLENALNSLSQDLIKKCGFEDLWKSEGKTLEKLDELFGLLNKKYCDKNETKKAFIYIENKINQLFTAVFGEKEDNNEGDALLAKKPFWSCVSCDKELDKYQGKLGEYKGWAQFPPKNTSPERMGKFGMGYTRMIEDRRENAVKDWEKFKSNSINALDSTKSITHSNMFPEIPKKKEKKNVF